MCIYVYVGEGDDSSREFDGEDSRNLRCDCLMLICLLALFPEMHYNPYCMYSRNIFLLLHDVAFVTDLFTCDFYAAPRWTACTCGNTAIQNEKKTTRLVTVRIVYNIYKTNVLGRVVLRL